MYKTYTRINQEYKKKLYGAIKTGAKKLIETLEPGMLPFEGRSGLERRVIDRETGKINCERFIQ